MCYIIRLDCRHEEDKYTVQYLQTIAEEQINNFSIFPWHHGCTDNIYMYVALTRPNGLRGRAVTVESLRKDKPNVCGWMTVRHEDSIGEVVFLASRKSPDRSYGGVGTALLDVFYTDCLEGTLNHGVPTKFIYLASLPAAKSFYMQAFRDKKTGAHTINRYDKPKAFFEMKPDSHDLYLPVSALPTARFMRQTTRRRPQSPGNQEVDMLMEIKEELDEEYAEKLERLLQSDKKDEVVLYLLAGYAQGGVDGVMEMLDEM